MKVSVVIPVYNAGPYVAQAVESALAQPQTAEVVLVEDKSPDDAYQTCLALAEKYDKVKLYTHPNHANMGAGPSRTLGVEKASFPFVAFLDADDYYLPNRFARTQAVFEQKPDAEGVYECAGIEYETEELAQKWQQTNKTVTRVEKQVSPQELFTLLMRETHGDIHLDALTVKKSVFDKTGGFGTARIGQDRYTVLKIAHAARLYPGSLEQPIAMRRIHPENRITASLKRNAHFNVLMYENLMDWMQTQSTTKAHRQLAFMRYVIQEGKLHDNFMPGLNGKKEHAKKFRKNARKYPQFFSPKALALHLIMQAGLFEAVKKMVVKIEKW